MSRPLLNRIEEFRKKQKLPILTLCKMMDVHNVTYHRWKNAGKITGAYHKIIEDFLDKNDRSAAAKTSDIAVVGVACYYPGASNTAQLWENILARRVQFRRMLDQRLPLSEYHSEDPKFPDKTYLTKAAFLENFSFDWGKLRIPRKTVESTDIAQWLALDTALKTFEDAGYKLSEIPLQNTGVIVGNTLTGEQTRSQTLRLRWPYVQKALNATLGHLGKSIEERSQISSEMEKIFKSAFYPVTEDSLAGGLANTIAGRICNYLNLKGGGYIVDGACSSSLLAVATAADALKMGNMDLALAGGVDISLDPFELVGFAKAGALAKDQMRVYDQKANGFLPGEGCGFVLLKRLKDAIRDKNYVYAVIKGWGISSDGRGGIMEPSSSGQSFAIGRAYKDLEYKISDVDFVEGHGTGTTKGDRVELEGIAAAIDKTIKRKDRNKRGCGITSFKSIVGHTKAAAGVGGLIKAVMAVNQHILPPTANCTHPNEVFKDKVKNLFPIILGGRLPLDKKARAGVSSAGFGGINCHITLESRDRPKEGLRSKLDERALFVSHQETEIFAFTSRTITHLKKIIPKFKEDLRNISIAEMADLAALLNKKVKDRLPIKVAIVTDSPEHLYDALVLLEKELDSVAVEQGQIHRIKAAGPNTHIILSNGSRKNRIGFLYPGQGSQRLNMTRTIVHRYQWARNLFKLSSLPLFEKIYLATDRFLTREEQQDFEKQLSDTRITQPAVVLSSLIWTEFLSRIGIEAQCTAGHSLGELTAFYKGGAFNREALIKFAQLRGELMASNGRTPGSMASLFCSKHKAEALVAKVPGNIIIANINSPNQTVVSGGKKEIEKIKELARKEDISFYPLNVSNAFHSSFMKEASDKIQKTRILPDTFKSKGVKVYSCMSGAALNGRLNLKEYFSKQVISPVDFVGAIESASKECDLMIEVGPGRVLSDLVKAISKETLCLPVESSAGNDRDLNIVLAEIFVRNVPIKWEELYKNRLIRTFVPASRKKFIENQCEHPLKIDKQVLKDKFLPVLLQVKGGAEAMKEPEVIIPGGLPELAGKDKAADLLMAFTRDITGFDRESISLDLKLLDDLNLDSIKAAELIGKAARTLGIPGQIDPSQWSNNTLGQISDRLNELVAAARSGAAKESAFDILKRYQDKTWVRDFVVDLRPEEIKTKNVNQLKALKNIVYLSGKNEEGLVKKIKNEFKRTKAKVQKSSHIDCLIAILPGHSRESGNPVHPYQELNRDSLRSSIEQLHQITDLASSNRLGKDSFVVFVQFGGGATAVASTLFLERPDLKVRIIDFDARTDEGKISQRIIDELQTYEPFSSVRYDRQLTRRVVYYDNSSPSEYKKRDISWSDKDIVLVTGGAKGITAQCALEFARATKAQMVLMGRSPLPSVIASEAKQSLSNEIIQTLKQFKNEGLKCSYYQCDVTNEKDVFRTIGEIEKKAGLITGFIHGAGLNSLKRLKQASVQEAFQEALPKVMGAVNVCNALKNHPPKLIVGITSIIGLTGMEGSGWYGFSNEILDLYLSVIASAAKQSRSTIIPEVVTIAYSIWDELGMGAKLGSINRLAEKGIGAIPVKEGIKHFKQLVEGDPGTQQVIVAARVAGIATWKSPELKANNFRFLEKIEYLLPGVELIAQANLSVEDDPYLLDHNWKGSLLFPFVFGFEAMAQAVAYLLGIEKFDHLKAKDINLQRPIPVSQEAGATIEIHALVLEHEKNNSHSREGGNPVQVKVEIYSQESAYKEPHFSAVFEVGNSVKAGPPGVIASPSGVIASEAKQSLVKKAGKVIDLDMQTDIYGPILFQGKSFQCIEQIHELYYDEETKKGECVFTSAYNKTAEEFLKKNKKFNKRFLIGDPFFIDSILQSMQIVVSQDACLPNYIEEIYVEQFLRDSVNKVVTNTTVQRVSKDELKGDSSIKMKRGINLLIKNCRLKVLDHSPNKPSANDLVNPIKRDRRLFGSYLNELSKVDNLILPEVYFTYSANFVTKNKEQRRDFINHWLEGLGYKGSQKLIIEYSKDNKPTISSPINKVSEISISHKGNYLIMSLGETAQGIDIEDIQERNIDEWQTILKPTSRSILEQLLSIGTDLNIAGTCSWSIIEAIYKATGQDQDEIVYEKLLQNKYLFTSKLLGKDKKILSSVIELTRGKKKIITLIVNVKTISDQNFNLQDKISFASLENLGFKIKDLCGASADYTGPQDQLMFKCHFPVTFKNILLFSKNVYFTCYFDFCGTLREYTVLPIAKQFLEAAKSGKSSMVTKMTSLDVYSPVQIGDILEGRVWMGPVKGSKNSTINLYYEWHVINRGEKYKVADCVQETIWIMIDDTGQAKIDVYPPYIKEYVDLMKPKTTRTKLSGSKDRAFEFCSGLELDILGQHLPNKYKVFEKTITATLEHSNLLSNIYFSSFAKWIGQLTDEYCYTYLPEYYQDYTGQKEIFCSRCAIDFLNEAFPFDKILIEMFICKIFENGVEFYFEFYKVIENKKIKKLAYAKQQLLFVSIKNNDITVLKVPDQFIKMILRLII